jgi:hypothetical protein
MLHPYRFKQAGEDHPFVPKKINPGSVDSMGIIVGGKGQEMFGFRRGPN